MPHLGFFPANILLPNLKDLTKWSVVACDQYTSSPDYWKRIEHFVGDTPSTLHLIYPEVWLEREERSKRIAQIHHSMVSYQLAGYLSPLQEGYIYLERTLRSGKVRRGLIGCVDLENYSYKISSQSPLRPTEGTVESRLPPRIQIRQGAPLELPHVMILVDDPEKTILEPLEDRKSWMSPLYSFSLMGNGGHVKGWFLDEKSRASVEDAMRKLANRLYNQEQNPLCLAVGDGNHSLAAAKACFEQIKQKLPSNRWRNHPARYALVELCNLHDDGLTFEPIHRVVYTAAKKELLKSLSERFSTEKKGNSFSVIEGKNVKTYFYTGETADLVKEVQDFLDTWATHYECQIDYIHGDDTLKKLCAESECVGILLPGIEKTELFPRVQKQGPLSRKSFSLGEAWDKRYYLEARAISLCEEWK